MKNKKPPYAKKLLKIQNSNLEIIKLYHIFVVFLKILKRYDNDKSISNFFFRIRLKGN